MDTTRRPHVVLYGTQLTTSGVLNTCEKDECTNTRAILSTDAGHLGASLSAVHCMTTIAEAVYMSCAKRYQSMGNGMLAP